MLSSRGLVVPALVVFLLVLGLVQPVAADPGSKPEARAFEKATESVAEGPGLIEDPAVATDFDEVRTGIRKLQERLSDESARSIESEAYLGVVSRQLGEQESFQKSFKQSSNALIAEVEQEIRARASSIGGRVRFEDHPEVKALVLRRTRELLRAGSRWTRGPPSRGSPHSSRSLGPGRRGAGAHPLVGAPLRGQAPGHDRCARLHAPRAGAPGPGIPPGLRGADRGMRTRIDRRTAMTQPTAALSRSTPRSCSTGIDAPANPTRVLNRNSTGPT